MVIVPHLFVVHIMAGTLAGTESWFHNPSAKVSAHLGTGKGGLRYQWVDTVQIAYAEASYNGRAWSIENEGNAGDSLTPPQLESVAQAFALWSDLTGHPPGRGAPDVGGQITPGIVGHGELGAAGGSHPSCPGAPIVAQFPAIIIRATQILHPTPAPPAPPAPTPPEDEMDLYVTDSKGTGYVVASDLSSKRGLSDAPDAAALQGTGLYKVLTPGALSDALITSIPDA